MSRSGLPNRAGLVAELLGVGSNIADWQRLIANHFSEKAGKAIPTKKGNSKWSHNTVANIIKRGTLRLQESENSLFKNFVSHGNPGI